jgi:hypothetical protein
MQVAGRLRANGGTSHVVGFSPLLIALFLGSIAAAGAETECTVGHLNGMCQISVSAGEQGGSFVIEKLGLVGSVLLIKISNEWALSISEGGHAKFHGNAILSTIQLGQDAILEVNTAAPLYSPLSTLHFLRADILSLWKDSSLSNLGHIRTARI